jgi:hypothetical protein
MRERTEEQKKRSRENARRWRAANPEAARESSRRWKERNPEAAKQLGKKKRHRPYNPVRSKELREIRLKDPAYRAMVNEKANERAKAVKQWLDDYKLAKGCVDCGYRSHPRALQFDHVRGTKAMNVCFAKSIGGAQREIEKCEVRCANCHFIKTSERLAARRSERK